MKYTKMSLLTLMSVMLITNSNTIQAYKFVPIAVEKFIKTTGISTLEQSILTNARYISRSGKLVAERNSTFFPNVKDALGRTNIQRMEKGLAPIGKDGKPVELHHLKQKDNGIIVELTSKEHKVNSKILHSYKKKSEIKRNFFNKFKNNHWKERAMEFK